MAATGGYVSVGDARSAASGHVTPFAPVDARAAIESFSVRPEKLPCAAPLSQPP